MSPFTQCIAICINKQKKHKKKLFFPIWCECFPLVVTVAGDFADPRVDGWFMMGSPIPSFLICVSYVYAVVVVGPKFMEKRQPYNIKNVMLVYNFAMVLLSGYCFIEVRYSS